MSLTTRAIAIALLCAALIAGWWRLTAHYERIGYDKRKGEDDAATELQREANRGRTSAAETKFFTQAAPREKFIESTAKEVRHDAENLAACIVSPAALDRLRSAAECASEDRPASCGAGDSVQPSK
jgi:hypothetical protein